MSAQKYTKPIVYTNNLPIFLVFLRAITPKINHILLQFVLNPSNRFNRPQACFILVKGQKSKVKGFSVRSVLSVVLNSKELRSSPRFACRSNRVALCLQRNHPNLSKSFNFTVLICRICTDFVRFLALGRLNYFPCFLLVGCRLS